MNTMHNKTLFKGDKYYREKMGKESKKGSWKCWGQGRDGVIEVEQCGWGGFCWNTDMHTQELKDFPR